MVMLAQINDLVSQLRGGDFNIQDPSMNIAAQQETLADRLRQSQSRQASRRAPQIQQYGRAIAAPNFGELLAHEVGGLLSTFEQRNLQKSMADLANEDQRRTGALIDEYNAPTTRTAFAKTLAKNSPMGASVEQPSYDNVEQTVEMSPDEIDRRNIGIGMRMMNVPSGKAMGAQILNQTLAAPDKRAAAAQAVQDKRDQMDILYGQYKIPMLEKTLANQKDISTDRNTTSETVATGKNTTTLAKTDADNANDLAVQGLKNDGVATKGTGKVDKELQKRADLVIQSQALLRELEGNKKLFDWRSVVTDATPDFLGGRAKAESFVFSPEDIQKRASMALNASKIVHDLYGASLTKRELGAKNKFIPLDTDPYDTVISKIKAAIAHNSNIANAQPVTAPSGGTAGNSINDATAIAKKAAPTRQQTQLQVLNDELAAEMVRPDSQEKAANIKALQGEIAKFGGRPAVQSALPKTTTSPRKVIKFGDM